MSAAGPDDQVSLTGDEDNEQPQPTSEENPQPAEPSTTLEEGEEEQPQETSAPPTTSTETPPEEDQEPSTRERTTATSSSEPEEESSEPTSSTSSEQPEEESSPAETATSSSAALVTSERVEASSESSEATLSSSPSEIEEEEASTTSSDSTSSSALSESSAFVTSTRPSASASWPSVSLDEASTSAAETSDKSDEGNLSTGAIIGVSVAGVVVLCLLLALLGRSRFLIAKWTKRSRRASTSSVSPDHSVMREAGDAYATLPGSDSKSCKEPVDFSPSPVYRQSSAHSASAPHSGASLHSRRSSRAPPALDFDTATNAQVIPTALASVQPTYPPLPPMPDHPMPRRQQTFSEYGRVESPMVMAGPGVNYSPSLNAPSAPWDDHRASMASMSQSSAPFAAASAPIARPAPQRSSTMPMPMLYTRPASSATEQWETQGMNAPIPRVSSPMSPNIASPMMHDAAYRASMRASVYVQPEEARQSRASVFDPNMMFFAR